MNGEKTLAESVEPVHEGIGEKLLNFFELDEKAEAELRERIKVNDGLVRVLVHPYFDTSKHQVVNRTSHEKRRNAIERAIEGWMKKTADETPPLFFMEEWRKVANLQERLMAKPQNVNNLAYIVPTVTEGPEPKLSKERWRENSWAVLFKKFRELGVKRVIMGGQLLRVELWDLNVLTSYEDLKNPMSQEEVRLAILGCVGAAAMEFSEKFDVEISSLSAPLRRLDIKFLEENLKVMQAASIRSASADAKNEYETARLAIIAWLHENQFGKSVRREE